MRFRNLAAFVIVLIALGILIVSGQNRVYNQRVDTSVQGQTTIKESKIKNSPTNNLETLSAPLTELKTEIVSPGDENSAQVKLGDTITVNYRGWIASTGKMFDESFNHFGDDGFKLIAVEGVIQGWKGIVGMKVGEVRRLKIPASLGYGTTGYGEEIPPNTDLIFDIELLNIQ